MNEIHAQGIEVLHMIMRITISIVLVILGNLYIPRKWDHVQNSIKRKSTNEFNEGHLRRLLFYSKLGKALVGSLQLIS